MKNSQRVLGVNKVYIIVVLCIFLSTVAQRILYSWINLEEYTTSDKPAFIAGFLFAGPFLGAAYDTRGGKWSLALAGYSVIAGSMLCMTNFPVLGMCFIGIGCST
jgi:hypothetical protein